MVITNRFHRNIQIKHSSSFLYVLSAGTLVRKVYHGKGRKSQKLLAEDERGVKRRMKISNEGLDLIEQQADKRHMPEMMVLCQILREIRELKQLFQQSNNSCSGSNYGSSCTDDREDERGA